ncbi:hypothetical protein Q7O44_22545, partial [Shigella flexneri]|nr:hypothetical protein [Shigella flexneri]
APFAQQGHANSPSRISQNLRGTMIEHGTRKSQRLPLRRQQEDQRVSAIDDQRAITTFIPEGITISA